MLGLGALWHGPRMLAEHGGAFVVAWAVCLVVWTLPLLMFEFAAGRAARTGPIGATNWVFGKTSIWRGAFAALVALGLLGGTVRAGGRALELVWAAGRADRWGALDAARPSPGALLAVGGAAWLVVLVARGGLHERLTRVCIAAVFAALLICALWTWTRPGADAGLAAALGVDWWRLTRGAIWFDAVMQSAWSMGAGIGLMTCTARAAGRGLQARRESFATAFGVSVAALLAALIVLPLQAARVGADGLTSLAGSAASGVPSTTLENVFMHPDDAPLALLYQLAVLLACFMTTIAVLELFVRSLRDRDVPRRRALLVAFFVSTLLIAAGEASPSFAANQEWVWRLGIVVACGLLTLSVLGHGANRFWIELIGGPEGRVDGGGGFRFVAGVLLPLLVVMLGLGALSDSWTLSAGSWSRWLSPIATDSLGTCVAQWAVAIAVLKVSLR